MCNLENVSLCFNEQIVKFGDNQAPLLLSKSIVVLLPRRLIVKGDVTVPPRCIVSISCEVETKEAIAFDHVSERLLSFQRHTGLLCCYSIYPKDAGAHFYLVLNVTALPVRVFRNTTVANLHKAIERPTANVNNG